jgi:ribonuclease E
MAALHGREDPLLDPARFPRLLRQANDAEIADVRKVGDDDYEISGRRSGGAAPQAPAASAAGPAAEPGERAATAEPVAEVSPGARENGQRFGVRFRRGSRGGLRTAEIPLIGVVQVDSPPAEGLPVEAVAVEAAEPAKETERKPARPRRAPRKKPAPSRSEGAATATAAKADKPGKADPSGEDPDAAPAAPVKRGRSRARKKAE